jgi:AbrB family looped-hinge helix DNA binding protein
MTPRRSRVTIPLVKVKEKGQMTIPAEIRGRLQIKRGDLLEAKTDGKAIILTPKAVVDRDEVQEPPDLFGRNAVST